MIAKLKGILVETEGNFGLIQTPAGVYYEVILPPSLLSQKTNTNLELYTHLQIRDDSHILFGFENKKQKELFKLLISVSGVGPKTAFQIVSFSDNNELIAAVRGNDVEYFSKVPGLGRKTALKIILELSQKFDSDFDLKQLHLSPDDKTVIDALVSLGFKAHDARSILSNVDKGLSVEEKIKAGIRLGSKKI